MIREAPISESRGFGYMAAVLSMQLSRVHGTALLSRLVVALHDLGVVALCAQQLSLFTIQYSATG